MARNRILVALRVPAERGNTLLRNSWRTLSLITLDPNRITETPSYPAEPLNASLS